MLENIFHERTYGRERERMNIWQFFESDFVMDLDQNDMNDQTDLIIV